METRDSETITSTLLKFQNKKLMRSKDFILITILLNLMILVLTFIQEVATFEELEDYEVITISIIVCFFSYIFKTSSIDWTVFSSGTFRNDNYFFPEAKSDYLLFILVD